MVNLGRSATRPGRLGGSLQGRRNRASPAVKRRRERLELVELLHGEGQPARQIRIEVGLELESKSDSLSRFKAFAYPDLPAGAKRISRARKWPS
jgi:hypothetical protein